MIFRIRLCVTDLRSPNVAKCNLNGHVSSGVQSGDILDVLKVKGGAGLEDCCI